MLLDWLVRFCRHFTPPYQLIVPPRLSLGFDYHFNAIQNEDNELFKAYKDMFEFAISQPNVFRSAMYTYAPIFTRFFVSFVL